MSAKILRPTFPLESDFARFVRESFGAPLRGWQEETLRLMDEAMRSGKRTQLFFTAGRNIGKSRFSYAAAVHSLPISDDAKRELLRGLFPED